VTASGERHGFFTHAILEALKHGDTNGNGTIELSEIVAYVQNEVPKLAAANGGAARRGDGTADAERAERPHRLAGRGFRDCPAAAVAQRGDSWGDYRNVLLQPPSGDARRVVRAHSLGPILAHSLDGKVRLSPPPKAYFEERQARGGLALLRRAQPALSQIDRQMAREAYPPQAAMQHDPLQKRADTASVALATLNLNRRQLSRVGRELTHVLSLTPRKIILDFNLARASGKMRTGGPAISTFAKGASSASQRHHGHRRVRGRNRRLRPARCGRAQVAHRSDQ
jgi:hypothetical protein